MVHKGPVWRERLREFVHAFAKRLAMQSRCAIG